MRGNAMADGQTAPHQSAYINSASLQVTVGVLRISTPAMLRCTAAYLHGPRCGVFVTMIKEVPRADSRSLTYD